MGKTKQSWQNIDTVLIYFGKQKGPARRNYHAFVAKGIELGRQRDLTGGGLIRSLGGWEAITVLKKAGGHAKSDERILGDGDFVQNVLSQSQETLMRRYALQTNGVDLDFIADRVAQLLDMESAQVWLPGKYKQQVAARSLLCFWAVRELGVSMTALGKRLDISTVVVSK